MLPDCSKVLRVDLSQCVVGQVSPASETAEVLANFPVSDVGERWLWTVFQALCMVSTMISFNNNYDSWW